MSTTPRPGDPAPGFRLTTHTGGGFDLHEHLGRNVAVVFFPLAWTPV